MVPDAAARLPDIRDALFDVSQEVRTRPIARAAGPYAHASGNLHATDAEPDQRFRPSIVDPIEQRGRALWLADDFVLRRARRDLLATDGVAYGSVTRFLRCLCIALSPAFPGARRCLIHHNADDLLV